MARKRPGRARKRETSSSSKDDKRQVIATNRKARHDYLLLAKVEAGLVLLGSEVKSLRVNGANIKEGFARVQDGELWLMGVHIPTLFQASSLNHEPLRPRKCLVHRRELRKIQESLEAKGQTMVPLVLYFKGVRVKVELALATGRRKGDKRTADREKEERKRIREYTS